MTQLEEGFVAGEWVVVDWVVGERWDMVVELGGMISGGLIVEDVGTWYLGGYVVVERKARVVCTSRQVRCASAVWCGRGQGIGVGDRPEQKKRLGEIFLFACKLTRSRRLHSFGKLRFEKVQLPFK